MSEQRPQNDTGRSPNGEIDRLVGELLDRESTQAERDAAGKRLASLVKSQPALAERYLDLIEVHAALGGRFEGAPAEVRLPRRKAASETSQTDSAKASVLSVGYWREHRLHFAALALSLTLVFWAGIYGFIVFSGSGPSSNTPESNRVATVTNMRGAAWAEGTKTYEEQASLAAGDTLALADGFVEVTFKDGAVVLLEAPVEFTVTNRGAGTLEQGRLVARIEKSEDRPQDVEGVAFSISTPLALIIDHGTEFGVEVAEDGTTMVKVYEGLVEATAQGQARTRAGRPLRLQEGQSALIAADRGVLAQEEASEFTRELPEEAELAGDVTLRPSNYRMVNSRTGTEAIELYAFGQPYWNNTLLSFDLSAYHGQQVAGPAQLTLVVKPNSFGARFDGPYELELRQLNRHNAGVDLDAATGCFLDGTQENGTLHWRDNSGGEIEFLDGEQAILAATSGRISSLSGPFAGDTALNEVVPGTRLVFTIPRETLQSWLDEEAPPIVLLACPTVNVDYFHFGTGGQYALPTLSFDLRDAAD